MYRLEYMATTLFSHQLHTHVTLGFICRAPHNARVQRHRSGFLELQTALRVGIIHIYQRLSTISLFQCCLYTVDIYRLVCF